MTCRRSGLDAASVTALACSLVFGAEAWFAAFGFEPVDGDELQLSMIRR